ncbi:MAG: methyltransferase domain-containing protein [Bacteroidetes bacterium]|nr:methyltransferase domain-containing protein [Bacteroidota bacterium]
MPNQLRDKFIAAFERDKSRIQSWLVSWDYQKQLKNRKYTYDNLLNDFFTFSGKEDLPRWMNWFDKDFPDYTNSTEIEKLALKSFENEKQIFQNLGIPFTDQNYLKRVGVNNAHDFFIPQSYPRAARYKIKNVLDFGAGYGRQSNLWVGNRSEGMYVGVDAIESSYCLQNLYYHSISDKVNDYIDNPDSFKFDPNFNGIQHVPTWRFDLIPDASMDMVMCVQVLPELNSKLVRFVMDQFKRVLKPGGILYIRDNAYTWKPAGQMNMETYLKKLGFELEFKAHVIDIKDIHGIPRIWRNADEEVKKAQTMDLKAKVKLMYNNADAMTGGLLKKVSSKLK